MGGQRERTYRLSATRRGGGDGSGNRRQEDRPEWDDGTITPRTQFWMSRIYEPLKDSGLTLEGIKKLIVDSHYNEEMITIAMNDVFESFGASEWKSADKKPKVVAAPARKQPQAYRGDQKRGSAPRRQAHEDNQELSVRHNSRGGRGGHDRRPPSRKKEVESAIEPVEAVEAVEAPPVKSETSEEESEDPPQQMTWADRMRVKQEERDEQERLKLQGQPAMSPSPEVHDDHEPSECSEPEISDMRVMEPESPVDVETESEALEPEPVAEAESSTESSESTELYAPPPTELVHQLAPEEPISVHYQEEVPMREPRDSIRRWSTSHEETLQDSPVEPPLPPEAPSTAPPASYPTPMMYNEQFNPQALTMFPPAMPGFPSAMPSHYGGYSQMDMMQFMHQQQQSLMRGAPMNAGFPPMYNQFGEQQTYPGFPPMTKVQQFYTGAVSSPPNSTNADNPETMQKTSNSQPPVVGANTESINDPTPVPTHPHYPQYASQGMSPYHFQQSFSPYPPMGPDGSTVPPSTVPFGGFYQHPQVPPAPTADNAQPEASSEANTLPQQQLPYPGAFAPPTTAFQYYYYPTGDVSKHGSVPNNSQNKSQRTPPSP